MTFELPNLVKNLVVFHDSIGHLLDTQEINPNHNSIAYAELNSYKNTESVITAYSLSDTLLQVSADQLIAFTKTITEPIQTIAPFTCVRALIEASALAFWLLDPSIDVSTRVGRSFALRYEGLSQQVKYFKSIHDEALLENANSRINEVEKKACDLGFSKVIDKYGKRNGIAQQMPFITDLIRQTLDEEGTYRLLSAMAHGHNWAVQKLSFRRVASENPIFANDAEVNLFEKNIDPTAILFLCNKAFICHAKSEWFRFQLFGWDQKQLQEIMEITSTSLQINPENHFWEQAN